MVTLSVSVDEEVLKRAEARARERGISLDAVLASYVASFAGDAPQPRVVAAILEMTDRKSVV